MSQYQVTIDFDANDEETLSDLVIALEHFVPYMVDNLLIRSQKVES